MQSFAGRLRVILCAALQCIHLVACSEKLPSFKVIQLGSKGEVEGSGACPSGKQLSVTANLDAPGMGAVSKSNIIFVVDTSGSMLDELQKLQVSLPGFIRQLDEQLGANHKVVMHAQVSGWSLPGVYVHGRPVGSTDKMAKIELALGASPASSAVNMIPKSALFTEPGTVFHYVVVTDDIEEFGNCTPSAGQVEAMAPYSAASVSNYESCLINRYRAGVGSYLESRGFSHRLHAIHFKGGSTPTLGCAIGNAAGTDLAETGAPYVSLSMAFGGVSHDLCQDNWSELMTRLVGQVSSAAQGQAAKLEACSGHGVAVQRVVIRQGSYERVLNAQESGTFLFVPGTPDQAATVQLQGAFLQQLIARGELAGDKGYSLQVDYTVN